MTLFLFQKKVIFSAEKKRGSSFHGQITYDTIDVNIGDGLQTNGKFIAPESGTYGFTFSGVTANEKSNTGVKVYKDGNIHHEIVESPSTAASSNDNNIKATNNSWMMKLAKGQVVHLDVAVGKLFAGSEHFKLSVIFTGNLLMLDLEP